MTQDLLCIWMGHKTQCSVAQLKWSIPLAKQQLWVVKSGIWWVTHDSVLDCIAGQVSFFPFCEAFFFMYFSFWYYIYDVTAIVASSIELLVIGDSNPLLKIKEKNTTVWKEARAFVGNRPGGSRVSQWNTYSTQVIINQLTKTHERLPAML